jgi:hypothetical protein
LGSQDEPGKRNALAKAASPQSSEAIDGSKIAGALCQRMSKLSLTLVETERQKDRRTYSKGQMSATEIKVDRALVGLTCEIRYQAAEEDWTCFERELPGPAAWNYAESKLAGR